MTEFQKPVKSLLKVKSRVKFKKEVLIPFGRFKLIADYRYYGLNLSVSVKQLF